MPTYRKPRGMRRTTYKPKGKGNVPNAVKKYVRKVTARTRPEMKSLQSNSVEYAGLNPGAIATSFNWNECLSIAQGTTRDTRIGNEIYFHGLHSKGSWFNNGAVPVFIRRLVVGYSSGISAQTASAELFDTADGVGSTITAMGNNMGLITSRINKNQFKVYFDKVIKLSPTSAVDGTQTKMYNYFTKFGGKKIQFEGSTSGLLGQNNRIGEIWLVAQADNDTTTGAAVEQTYALTRYFTDP